MMDVVAEFQRTRKPGRLPEATVHEIRRRVIIEGEKDLAVAVDLGLHEQTVRQIVRGRRRLDVAPDAQLAAWLRAREGDTG